MKKIFNRYGVFGFIRLLYNILFSRIFISPKIKIVRTPFYIRGSKYIKWGDNFTSGVNLRIDADPQNINDNFILLIGDNVQVNDYVHIGVVKKVIIGNNVLIASKVYISDHNHGNYNGLSQSPPFLEPVNRPIYSQEVIIEDNVWIGEQVSILSGVTIGEGSIIGANSVVTKSIPNNSIAVGSPAIVIKTFNSISGKWEKK